MLTMPVTSEGQPGTSRFQPGRGLRNPHFQTILANGPFSPRPRICVRRERVELPDGDFLDLDWLESETATANKPLVLVLHGLTGSLQSRYAADLFSLIERQGWRAVLMNFRGCSGHPNRLPRTYHAGDTGDFEYVLSHLRRRGDGAPIAAVGYSLGGNVLLKHLGVAKSATPLVTGVAVSVPFDLEIAAHSLNKGLARLYQANLLKQLKKSICLKYRLATCPFDWKRAMRAADFFEFDDAVTAPLHGFSGVLDYYRKSSSKQYLGDISIPALIVHAEDDPFIDRIAIPGARELSATLTLEVSQYGGHVGFLQGWPHRHRNRWLPTRIVAHLAECFGIYPPQPATWQK
jgi:predicted alpha/beta-fold hydrolase